MAPFNPSQQLGTEFPRLTGLFQFIETNHVHLREQGELDIFADEVSEKVNNGYWRLDVTQHILGLCCDLAKQIIKKQIVDFGSKYPLLFRYLLVGNQLMLPRLLMPGYPSLGTPGKVDDFLNKVQRTFYYDFLQFDRGMAYTCGAEFEEVEKSIKTEDEMNQLFSLVTSVADRLDERVPMATRDFIESYIKMDKKDLEDFNKAKSALIMLARVLHFDAKAKDVCSFLSLANELLSEIDVHQRLEVFFHKMFQVKIPVHANKLANKLIIAAKRLLHAR